MLLQIIALFDNLCHRPEKEIRADGDDLGGRQILLNSVTAMN